MLQRVPRLAISLYVSRVFQNFARPEKVVRRPGSRESSVSLDGLVNHPNGGFEDSTKIVAIEPKDRDEPKDKQVTTGSLDFRKFIVGFSDPRKTRASGRAVGLQLWQSRTYSDVILSLSVRKEKRGGEDERAALFFE